MRIFIATLLFFALSVSGIGQNTLPDSIMQELQSKATNVDKINYLHSLSSAVFRSEPELNFKVLNRAYNIARTANIDTSIVDTEIKLGIYHIYSGTQDSALYWYQSALLKTLNLNDSSRLATAYGELGVYYYRQSNDPLALENLIKSYSIAEATNDIHRLAGLCNNIGNVYRYLGDLDKAKDFTLKSVKYKEQLKDSVRMGSSLHNLGIAYDELGDTDSALYYFKEAEWYKRRFNNLRGLTSTFVSLSLVFKSKQNMDSAFFYMDKAIELDRELGYAYGLGYDLSSRGQMHFEAGNIDKALVDVKEALSMAEDARLIKEATSLIADIYEQLGDYKSAAFYRKRYADFSDSVHQAEKDASLREMQVKFETDLKDNEIAELANKNKIQELQAEREKQFRLFLIVTSVLLIVAAGALYFRYKSKAKTNQVLDAKNKELQELNYTKDRLFSIISHDLKSPLSSFHTITRSLTDNWESIEKEQMKGFVESLRDSSKEVHDLMDNLLRWALSQTGQLKYNPEVLDPSETIDEVSRQLSNPMHASKINLSVNMNNVESINADNDYLKIILRNLISNAIKFSKMESTIEVIAQENDSSQLIAIKDSGVGINPDDLKKLFGEGSVHDIKNSANKGTGLGLTLCKELMEKMGGKIEVESELNKGSTFKLIFPKAA